MRRNSMLIALLTFTCGIAYGHPHMFIDTKIDVHLDGDRLDGLEITWFFDPMFTASIVCDYDANGNGIFSENEVNEVYESAFSNLANFDYFTFVSTGSTTLSPGSVSDFSVFMDGQVLVYRFFVEFDLPISNGCFSVAIYDRTFYCDILYHEDCPISLSGPGSENASFSIVQNRDIEIQYGGAISVSRDDRDYTGMAYPQQLVVTLEDTRTL